jgi:hypothetical protein
MNPMRPGRRRFLKAMGAAAAAGVGGLGGAGDLFAQAKAKKTPATPAGPAFKTRHVVFVVLGGGVRTRDVIGQEDCPNINAIIKAGMLVRPVKVRDVGHYGSTMTLLTGVDQKALADDVRTEDPTIFELLRKGRRLPNTQTWLTAAGSDWHSNLSFSRHPSYGVRYAANYITGDGVFTAELADVTNQFGEPRVPDETERKILADLGKSIDGSVAAATAQLRTGGSPPDVQERIRKYVLDELSGNVKKIESPGLRDIMAVHYGTNLLAVFKPTLLVMALVYHDLGHGNAARYQQVLRKNDAEIGRLWETIQKDEYLKATTSLVIMPEFGRNERENNKGGLDHDDKGPNHLQVFLVGAGPDFKRGELKGVTLDAADITPTLLHLLGVPFNPPAGKTAGKVASAILNG